MNCVSPVIALLVLGAASSRAQEFKDGKNAPITVEMKAFMVN